MANSPLMPPNRHIPYKKEGLIPAVATLLATAAVFLTAFAIHRATFREPTDVMMRQRGDQPGAQAEGGHAAGASHGGGAAAAGAAGGAHGATPATGAPAQGTPGTTH